MDLNTGCFTLVEGGEGGNCSNCNRLRLTANGMIKPAFLVILNTASINWNTGSTSACHPNETGKRKVNNHNLFHNIGDKNK